MRRKGVNEIEITGNSVMQIRIQAGWEGDRDGGDYQAGKWDYWEECHRLQSEQGEAGCDEAERSKRRAHCFALLDVLPALAQLPELSQLPALAQLRVVLDQRKRKYVLSKNNESI